MDKILHDPKDPKLWELWYIPYYGSCRILSINRIKGLYGIQLLASSAQDPPPVNGSETAVPRGSSYFNSWLLTVTNHILIKHLYIYIYIYL